MRKEEGEEISCAGKIGKHFYHQIPILTIHAEAQLHLKYDAKGEVNHFTQNTHGTEKQQVIGKIHLCPVQNMEKNLNTLLSQMWVRQISNIKQRNVLRTFFRVKTEIVQARQSTLFVQYKRLCNNMTQRKGLTPFL